MALSAMACMLLFSCSAPADVVKVVSPDGTGDYTTVQEAFDAVPEHYAGGHWIIQVRPGRYYEQLHLAAGKDHVVLQGEDAQTTVLWYDDYAGSETKGVKQSTWIEADDFTAVNITFLNPHQNIAWSATRTRSGAAEKDAYMSRTAMWKATWITSMAHP